MLFMELFKINNEDTKTRIEIFDFFKGGSVLLVLLHHVGIPGGKYILAFHMPLFFILSGYIYEHTKTIENKTSFLFFRQKAEKILIPYLGFEFINLLLSLILVAEKINLLKAFISIFFCINSNEYMGISLRLWFLPCIFVSEIWFYWIVKFIGEKKVRYFIPLFFFLASRMLNLVMTFRLPFTLDISLMATGFILCGYYLCPIVKKIEKTISIRLSRFMFVMCFVFFGISAYLNERLLMYIDEYGNYFLAIISALTGSYLFLWTLKRIYKEIRNGKIYNYILFLGRNSLLFFPIHLILLFVTEKIIKRMGLNMWWIKLIIVGIVCIPVINFVRIYLPFLSGQRVCRNKEKA